MKSLKSLAATIFDLQAAIENCERSGNSEWLAKHRAKLRLVAKLLPSGSGIDSGTEIASVNTKTERILLTCSFHHMDEHGGYDGWTDHKITVTPSFSGINVRVTGGNNRNDINEYLNEVYSTALAEIVSFPDYSGESEANIRRALDLSAQVPPPGPWLDEIEKALKGPGGDS